MSEYLPLDLFNQGFGSSLLSVIPPGAQLAPSSKIAASGLGKSPGVRSPSGLWHGYDWQKKIHTINDVRAWQQQGANVGLRAEMFPGLDLDVTSERLALLIQQFAFEYLGTAPVRVGKPPKRLLMYRTNAPFGRLRLYITQDKESHLVEWLGAGQQYLIHGIHPSGSAYKWDRDITRVGVTGLHEVTVEKARAFLTALAEHLDMVGYTAKVEGEGRLRADRAQDQTGLLAPTVEDLRAAVELIPNDLDRFAGWDDYIKMLHAVRAAAGPDEEDGFEIFDEWAGRWEGHGSSRDSGESTPEARRGLWRRTHGPFSLGWPWLAELARGFGYSDAANDFEPLYEAPNGDIPQKSPDGDAEPKAFFMSDQYLADLIVDRRKGDVRFVPADERWLVWDGSRWAPDGANRALEVVNRELVFIANRQLRRQGASAKEIERAEQTAMVLNSAGKAASVRQKMQTNRALALTPDQLDNHPWLLNTPAGVVDLKSGTMSKPDPDLLATKTTGIIPDATMPTPEWDRFLAEATAGDNDLVAFLQRHAGYSLTGRTTEQQFLFVYGPGGNGKGIYTGVLEGILGDYARKASMETFTETRNERHETELAALAGARLVIASETSAGRKWNEARIKALSGGERITARFLYQDQFTFMPTFKMMFVGNHRPVVRDVDPAMRRRVHMVPFVVTPKTVDPLLAEKLMAEYPGILAWAIKGALEWQHIGLLPPAAVREMTEDYLEEQDVVGEWLQQYTEPAADAWISSDELFNAYGEWLRSRGENPGKIQWFVARLANHKLVRARDPETRRRGFAGIRLIRQNELGVVQA